MKKSQKQPRPSFNFERRLARSAAAVVIGVDEVGRGALAGPLVVAAVRIEKNLDGVDDSKRLTGKARKALFHLICQNAQEIRLGVVQPREIDKVGIKSALWLAYERVLNFIDPSYLIATDNYSLFQKRFIKSIKGDQFFYSISAASIVAKVYRDNLMIAYHRLFPAYNWAENKGYGTAKHLEAIREVGITPLHRKSFIK